MSTLLSRIYDAKHRFEAATGMKATQLFLGPKEREEFKEYMGLTPIYRNSGAVKAINDMIAGMIVVHLANDGIRAGITA